MATQVGSLFWNAGIRTDQLVRDSRIIKSEFSSLTSAGGAVSKIFTPAGLGITSVGAGLVKLGKDAYDFSKEFESAFAPVITITSEGTEGIQNMEKAILDLSRTVPVTAKESADALYQIVSAGFDGEQGLELLNVASRAAVGGVTDTATAADGLTTVINAFGLSADDASKVADTFFTTVRLGKTTFGELSSTIANAASIAAVAGIEYTDLFAAIATLTKSGVPTAQAVTQVRSAILATTEVLGDAAFQGRTLQEAFIAVRESANGSNSALRESLGRVEALNAVLGLTGEKAKVAAEDLISIKNATGDAEAAFETMVESADNQLVLLQNNIKATLKDLGDAIKTGTTGAVRKINKLFEPADKRQNDIVANLYKGAIRRIEQATDAEERRKLVIEEIGKLQQEQLKAAAKLEGRQGEKLSNAARQAAGVLQNLDVGGYLSSLLEQDLMFQLDEIDVNALDVATDKLKEYFETIEDVNKEETPPIEVKPVITLTTLKAELKKLKEELENVPESEAPVIIAKIEAKKAEITSFGVTPTEKPKKEVIDVAKKEYEKLLEEYKTYETRRKELVEKGQNDIKLLLQRGNEAEAQQAFNANEKALEALDARFIEEQKAYTDWYENTLPMVIQQGADALQSIIGETEIKIATLEAAGVEETNEEIMVLRRQLADLEKAFGKINKVQTEKVKSNNFSDTVKTLNEVNTLVVSVASGFGDMTKSQQASVDVFKDMVTGAITIAKSLNTLQEAAKNSEKELSNLEKASIVLVILSSALKVFNGIMSYQNAIAEEQAEIYEREIKLVSQLTLTTIEYNKAIQETNKLFGEDPYGNALRSLDAYNALLQASAVFQEDLLSSDSIAKLLFPGATKFLIDKLSGTVKDSIDQIDTDPLTKILSLIQVITREERKFLGITTRSEETKNLLSLYPDLINANGQLNVSIAETILENEKLKGSGKVALEELIAQQKALEEYTAQFAEYIGSIFGGMADEISNAWLELYLGGEDAMANLEKSFSNMIKSFTQDMINFAFIQPFLDDAQKQIDAASKRYAAGDITAEDLADIVVGSVGEVLDKASEIPESALDALARIEEKARQAGFDDVFGREPETEAEALTGTIARTITEDTGTELVGLWTRTSFDIREQLTILTRSLNIQQEIANNTLKTTDLLQEIIDSKGNISTDRDSGNLV